MNLCCFELKESLIDLYLNVKIRNDTSLYDINSDKLEYEKEQLRQVDSQAIIEYLKSSIEILISLKEEDEQEVSKLKRKLSNCNSNMSGSIKISSRITVENNNTNDNCIGLMGDYDSQKSLDGGLTPLLDSHNISKASSAQPLPKSYEELIQKLEKDIRQHIALENQMRIHIENQANKIEELENSMAKLQRQNEEDIKEIKREKRRLDDLLTIRENENEKLQESITSKDKRIIEKEQYIIEFEKKLKHLEKKHEKQLTKLSNELSKYKKKFEQMATLQNNDLNAVINTESTQMQHDSLRMSQGSKVSKKSQNQSNDHTLQNNSCINLNFNGTQPLRQSNDFKHNSTKPIQNYQNLNLQQQQIYLQQQEQLSQTLNNLEFNKMRQEYKQQKPETNEQFALTEQSNIKKTLNNDNKQQQFVSQQKQVAYQGDTYQRVIEEKNEEINVLKSKLYEIHNQILTNQNMNMSQNVYEHQKRKKSNGRNQSQNSQAFAATNSNQSKVLQQSYEKKALQSSNSNHKRSKTTLNFYPKPDGQIEDPKVVMPSVSVFDLEKENKNITYEQKQSKQVTFANTHREFCDKQIKEYLKRTNSTDGLQKTELANSEQRKQSKLGENDQLDNLMHQSKTMDSRDKQSQQYLLQQKYQQLQDFQNNLQRQQMNSLTRKESKSNLNAINNVPIQNQKKKRNSGVLAVNGNQNNQQRQNQMTHSSSIQNLQMSSFSNQRQQKQTNGSQYRLQTSNSFNQTSLL